MCSNATCGNTPSIVTWSEPFKICYHDIVRQETPTPEKIRSHVWTRNGVNTSELQAHHCTSPEQWTWLLCSVCHTVKYSRIAKIWSIDRYWAANFMFSNESWCLVSISSGWNARFPPPALRTPMVSSDDDIFFEKFRQNAKSLKSLVSVSNFKSRISNLVLGVFDEDSSRNLNQVPMSSEIYDVRNF